LQILSVVTLGESDAVNVVEIHEVSVVVTQKAIAVVMVIVVKIENPVILLPIEVVVMVIVQGNEVNETLLKC